MRVELAAHIRLLRPFGTQPVHTYAADALAGLSGTVASGGRYGPAWPIHIARTTDYSVHPGLRDDPLYRIPSVCENLTIVGAAEIDTDRVFAQDEDLRAHDPVSIARKVATQDLSATVTKLLLCLTIAMPEAILTGEELLIDAGPTSYRYRIPRGGLTDAVNRPGFRGGSFT